MKKYNSRLDTMKRLLLATIVGVAGVAQAEVLPVTSFRYSGPYVVAAPLMMDSTDVNAKKYDVKTLLDTPLSLDRAKDGKMFVDSILPLTDGNAIHLLEFTIDNSHYAPAAVKVSGVKNYKVYMDGEPLSGKESGLTPRTRHVVVKCLTDGCSADTLRVGVETSSPQFFTVNPSGPRRYCMADIFTGLFIGSVAVSPSGKYLYTGFYTINPDGSNAGWEYELSDAATGRVLSSHSRNMTWMPVSDRLCYTRDRAKKIQLMAYDPSTGSHEVIALEIPDRKFTMSPTEDFLIYTRSDEGPKEKNEGLYEILNPEDRQPGWRSRGQLMKFDLATGLSTPLTFGHKSAWLGGISSDGRKVLVQVSELALGQRPSSVSSVYLLDLPTMKADTLIDRKPFIGQTILSPDGRMVAVTGCPEAFERIGCTLPVGSTPSMVNNQLFLLDVATRDVRPLTRDFDPSVEEVGWCAADGNIYFSAENRDLKTLYRVSPVSGAIDILPIPEDYVKAFDVSTNGTILACHGQSADTASRLYTMDTRKMRPSVRHDLNPERTAGIEIGQTYDWNFSTSRGDTIYARYSLPSDFDPTRKYPMIVYYYGGCSPVGRYLDTTYNPHLFNAHGFISLVINPSGAAGFGQEFASRHVATAGQGVADDIIEGTRQFAAGHEWVDASKIGCCGASYGGFMTQYLQTVTDIFAAAISHAGISDHTSYWGEGYWGHSYSEVSMGDKRPWTDPDLYVKQSPLYNADKINTPLLFLHGDSDTNVPVGESIQMFTALKLLGKPTAFVAVKDQNHHILDFSKREKWMNTMLAWFTKYLQDDPSWWEDMYPAKDI